MLHGVVNIKWYEEMCVRYGDKVQNGRRERKRIYSSELRVYSCAQLLHSHPRVGRLQVLGSAQGRLKETRRL